MGVDPDQRVIEQARQRGIYDQLLAWPAEQAHLPDASMGTVISNSVLEHLPQLDSVLAATARMLRPGGQFIFTVPTHAFSNWLALPMPGYIIWRNRALYHLNLWPTERWKRHLAQVGLEIEAERTYLDRNFVRAWDVLELLQQIWIARRRVMSLIWRRIPPRIMDRMAQQAATWNLATPAPGGGRLIVARKR